MTLLPSIFALTLNVVPLVVQASVSLGAVGPTVEEAGVFIITLAVHTFWKGLGDSESSNCSGDKLFHFCFKLIILLL